MTPFVVWVWREADGISISTSWNRVFQKSEGPFAGVLKILNTDEKSRLGCFVFPCSGLQSEGPGAGVLKHSFLRGGFMRLFKLLTSAIFVMGFVGCTDYNGGLFIPSNAELATMIGRSVDERVAHPYGYHAETWKQKDPSARSNWFVMGVSMAGGSWGGYFQGVGDTSYVAINTQEWARAAQNRGMSLSSFIDQYFAGNISLSPYEYDDLYRGVSYYGSGYYIDNNGNLYDEAGATQKDLETLAAIDREGAVRATSRKLAEEFMLSEAQSFRVARIASEWQTISKSRQMTAKDIEAFTKDIVGVDLSEIRTAAKKANEGDVSSMEDLIKKAANGLDTTPENMKSIMASMLMK
jgi:hypothetical protein